MFLQLSNTKIEDLRKECKTRKLQTKGKKIDLIKRLLPEVNDYIYLDKNKKELLRLCDNSEILNVRYFKNMLTRPEMILSFNVTKPLPKFNITITKLDSSEIVLAMNMFDTIHNLKREIIQNEGLVGSYIELYNVKGAVKDTKMITNEDCFTMVINTIPTINPYTGRTLQYDSLITRKIMECYSNPDVFLANDGKIKKISAVQRKDILFRIPLFNYHPRIVELNAKEEFIIHLLDKFDNTNIDQNILDTLRYYLKHIEYIKTYGIRVTNRYHCKCLRDSEFRKNLDTFVEWKYHPQKDYDLYSFYLNL